MTDYYMAFFDDDKHNPIGLLEINDQDTLMRGLGEWTPKTPDNKNFDESELINVSEDFIAFFDMLDKKDELPTYKQTQKFKVEEDDE